MRTSFRALAVCAATTLLCLSPGLAQADPAPADRCQDVTFPVPQGTVAGTLCLPDGPTDTVMVLESGSNYNHLYWDFPYQPETYNFRRAMNAAGYATLVADRLGNGASSRPPSFTLTATETAESLHTMVQALRGGLAGNAPFAKVVTAGHSLTSGTAIMEATSYHDVDGILLTGYSHTLSVPDVLGVISTYYQAVNDPGFAGRGYDPGYLVTRPGTRAADFYGIDPDPQVVALDEANKETFSLTEYPDGLLSTLPGMSSFITVPVMIVDGSRDRMVCGPGFSTCTDTATLYDKEHPYFSPDAKLRTYVLPNSGHAINLAPNTRDYHAQVVDWMKSVTG
ncbi:alpha/beta fold hydrolase [Nocardia sp. CDC153]|uniref:alpha/beta hydrolase n=1 Tax=Nocardia sp. CDC153 TaxID=3112167 RepID=UPI002DBAD3B3|nr:alpha/beta fold hydrolase [Nocardia sp. CDC153]MEC3952651.1 alpha/beta fold hydrolase [Nocardia sp. CDC153]